MATTPRAGKYLNLEKVRVSEDPKTNTVHITSKDPDVPGGFHISLNSGTATEQKLRTLLEQRNMLGKKELSTNIIPNYASFYRTASKNVFFNAIRSIHETPQELMAGDPHIVPLGVYGDGEEGIWNIFDFSNLVFIDDQIVNIVRNHVEYWEKEWSFVDFFDSGAISSELAGENLYAADKNFINHLIDLQVKILAENEVNNFDEIRDSEKTHKRIMILGTGAAFDTFNRIVGTNPRSLLFEKKRDQSMALQEFYRLGIHFALDINASFSELVAKPKIREVLANDCFPNTQIARVKSNAETFGYVSDVYEAQEFLGLKSQTSSLHRIYEI